jgi:hypothetical protein
MLREVFAVRRHFNRFDDRGEGVFLSDVGGVHCRACACSCDPQGNHGGKKSSDAFSDHADGKQTVNRKLRTHWAGGVA